MSGEASYTIGEEDCVAAHRVAFLALLRGPFVRSVLIIGAGCGLLMALAQLFLDGADPMVAIGSGLLMAVAVGAMLPLCALINYLKVPKRARLTYSQCKLLHYPETVAWDDATIRFTSARGTMTTSLGEYHRWADGRGVFLLYTSDAAFQMVPQRTFAPEALADLRRTLVEHGPPQR